MVAPFHDLTFSNCFRFPRFITRTLESAISSPSMERLGGAGNTTSYWTPLMEMDSFSWYVYVCVCDSVELRDDPVLKERGWGRSISPGQNRILLLPTYTKNLYTSTASADLIALTVVSKSPALDQWMSSVHICQKMLIIKKVRRDPMSRLRNRTEKSPSVAKRQGEDWTPENKEAVVWAQKKGADNRLLLDDWVGRHPTLECVRISIMWY